MDNYANFWIKCPREAPFYRPVDEVLKWEFIDPPKPLPASAPPTEETPAVETAAVETPAVDVQAPAVETPAAHVLHTVEPLSESEMQRVDQYYQFINQPLDQFIDRPLVQPPPQQHDYHTRSTPAATAVPPPHQRDARRRRAPPSTCKRPPSRPPPSTRKRLPPKWSSSRVLPFRRTCRAQQLSWHPEASDDAPLATAMQCA